MRVDPRWLAKHARVGDPGRPTAAALRWIRRLALPLVRLAHRPTLEGLEHLPEGPFLMVINHSAIGTSEVFALIVKWIEQFGVERPLTGMAHPFAFVVPPLSIFMRHMGAIPSTYAAAAEALGSGVAVFVFPGGDWESTRPFWQASQVQFKGRKGFLRVARRAGVPIVPLGIRGSVYSAPMILRSRLLSWLLVLPRLLGVTVFPISLLGLLGAIAIYLAAQPLGMGWTVALIWLWLALPFSLLPWLPVSIHMTVGEPIPHAELFSGDDDEEELAGAYDRVVAAVQVLVDPPSTDGVSPD